MMIGLDLGRNEASDHDDDGIHPFLVKLLRGRIRRWRRSIITRFFDGY